MDKHFLDAIQRQIVSETKTVGQKTRALSSSVLRTVLDRLGQKATASQSKLVPIAKSQKGAVPVASLDTGGVLMSDGTTKGTPDVNALQALKRNVLDQNYFTPQAKAYLEQMPVKYGNIPVKGALGQYQHGKGVIINPALLQRGNSSQDFTSSNITLPAEVLAHEFMHSLDANINAEEPASYPAQGGNSGDSYNFYSNISRNATPQDKGNVRNFLKSYPLDENTRDVESFAQYAAPKGEKVLLKPGGDIYKNIFIPASRAINFSPLFPTLNNFEDVFKSFSSEGAI